MIREIIHRSDGTPIADYEAAVVEDMIKHNMAQRDQSGRVILDPDFDHDELLPELDHRMHGASTY